MGHLILTFPKTGSNLLAYIFGAKPYPAMTIDFEKIEINKIINDLKRKVKNNESIRFHYPYNAKLKEYFESLPNYILLHTLYRDPRDIICSIHRAIYIQKKHTFLDNVIPGIKLHKLPKQETLNLLIENMLPKFEDYNKWGETGLFLKQYYSQIIKHPASRIYTPHKIVGENGNYKKYMTEEQIEKSNKIYGELIELWKPQR